MKYFYQLIRIDELPTLIQEFIITDNLVELLFKVMFLGKINESIEHM